MKTTKTILQSTAIAALFAAPLATAPAFAQTDTTQTGQIAQNQAQADQTTQTGDGTNQSASGSETADGQQQDAVVATVGGTEILSSDLMTAIGMLPPQMRQQPPQMLVPMALEQLILRELVLAEAREAGLQNDPEVIALVEGQSQAAQDNALVQVWLEREMNQAVTDQAVQLTYDQAVAEGQENLPPIDQVRPQIEQFLRQQAMRSIQADLRDGAEVVLFDATGNPVQQSGGQQGQTSQGGGTGGGSANDTGGGNTGDNAGSTGNSGTGSGAQSGNASGNASDNQSGSGN